ncbi:MAG: signal recognition particle-docking protein FtsY [Candidatus Melainabacteria bacterium]|nr:signal recognition particle-docking protein FtsY [Candidatus Melainabacteria bacterium]
MQNLKQWLLGNRDKSNSDPPTPPAENPDTATRLKHTSLGGFQRLSQALANTGKALWGGLTEADAHDPQQPFKLTDARLDEIEENLIRSDVGVETAAALVEDLRRQRNAINSQEELRLWLKQSFVSLLQPTAGQHLQPLPDGRNGQMAIYMMVGVNGAGKTTVIGKLAHRLVQAGQRVLIGAGDTFRAAADDQLAVWAERAGASLVRREAGADPGAVVFETLHQAKAQATDVVILDTAGRLQNKYNLMEELRKVGRVLEKEKPETAQVEILLVVDATTGQNALQQAAVFKEALPVTGVALTKLDGSAKGGIVLAIAKQHQLPVRLVGVGETIDDLQDFDAQAFVEALFPEA